MRRAFPCGTVNAGFAVKSLAAIVLAIALMAPGTALGQALYDCAMSGTVSSECCCPAPESDAAPSDSTKFEAACCTVKNPPAALGAPARLEAQRLEPGPQLVALVPAAAVPTPPRIQPHVLVAGDIRGPPAAAVPLFVRHCSFLI